MDSIKDIIKQKNFVISNIIIKNIAKFNLSLSEFLLLLYFININDELDTVDIKDKLSLDESVIIESFNSLSKIGLIEIKVNKKNKIYEEKISLDNFYNKLILNSNDNSKESDIYSDFEKEFGRTLSPIEYETISKWLENNISEETIKKALKEAVLNGVNNLRYIDKILFEWSKKDLKNKSNNLEDTKIFNYNWLDDDNES